MRLRRSRRPVLFVAPFAALFTMLLAALPIAHAATEAPTADIAVTVVDDKAAPVADAVVVAVPLDGNLRLPRPPATEVVDQVDKEFLPKVKPILVGSAVTFPNHDNVRHHVYSFSAAKRFELPLYAGVPARPVLFDKPGVVVLGCNIHDWMIGYIYVSDSPYYAKTDAQGHALLTDLPPRAYAVRVWHPQLAVSEDATRMTVEATHAGRFEQRWTLALKPELRVRRAPTPQRGNSY